MAKRAGRTTAGTSRPVRTSSQSHMNTYVDGNTVRKIQPIRQPEAPVRHSASRNTRKNRERALQMNLSYVIFLTAAAVVTVMVCINYLKLQAQNTTYQKKVTAMSTQLSEMKLENDNEYNRIVSSVDLQYVKDVAMNELGMTYASEDQIVTYDGRESDYVKQYQDIPTE